MFESSHLIFIAAKSACICGVSGLVAMVLRVSCRSFAGFYCRPAHRLCTAKVMLMRDILPPVTGAKRIIPARVQGPCDFSTRLRRARLSRDARRTHTGARGTFGDLSP